MSFRGKPESQLVENMPKLTLFILAIPMVFTRTILTCTGLKQATTIVENFLHTKIATL